MGQWKEPCEPKIVQWYLPFFPAVLLTRPPRSLAPRQKKRSPADQGAGLPWWKVPVSQSAAASTATLERAFSLSDST